MPENDRQRRILDNEQQFKAFNAGLRAGDSSTGPKMQAVCECGRSDCYDRLDISDQEWQETHQHPNRYVIALGHELPEAERIVSSTDRYAVVEKNIG